MRAKRKLIVLVGPTAAGKSELAVQLAKKFGGEIVSADSRQVYKGMDLGTGKITEKEKKRIPHHLLSIASPRRTFTVRQYQERTDKAIAGIQERGKIPFLTGGSPLYVYAVTDGWSMPRVKPDPRLRKRLEKLGAAELFSLLLKLDPRRARTIEKANRRRLVRALEIVLATGRPVPKLEKRPLPYPVLFLGITRSREELKSRVKKRFQKRMRQGMLQEVRRLHREGISWKRLEEFGLEYRLLAQYLQGKIPRKETEEKTLKAILSFARRQMAWFKKDPRIHWIKNLKEAERLVAKF